ncbi:MAG: glutamine-hydrolyzing carbamoyl-phosphate synthase small subunit, partial [Butyricicoccus sp.]
MKKAYLLLANGMLFEGQSVGCEGSSIGEIVFNTGMAGYQEVLTDPSYYGQTVCMTYPLIGNYGVNPYDGESRKSWVRGFIMRHMSGVASNFRTSDTLDAFLKAQGVVGLAGIDTRRLTKVLRNSGVMNGIVYSEGYEPDEAMIEEMKHYVIRDAVKSVTIDSTVVYPAEGEQKYRVALLDFGVKTNIVRELCARGCEVTLLNAYTDPQEILAGGYDGIMLSNGPGDPATADGAVHLTKEVLGQGLPLFGICFGNQILGRALGLGTYKMKFGHRG